MKKSVLIWLIIFKSTVLFSQTNFFSHSLNPNSNFKCQSVIVEDIDLDNDPDIIATTSVDGEGARIYWFENNGIGELSFHVVDTTTTGASRIYSCDFDNDGDTDILSVYSGVTGNVKWFENDGFGNFSAGEILIGSAGNVRELLIADLDSDGDEDIVYRLVNNVLEVDNILWLENQNGQFYSHSILSVDEELRLMSVSDLDDDGDRDIIVNEKLEGGSPQNYQLLKITYDGIGNFVSDTVYIEESFRPVSLQISDLDDDNDNDIIACSLNGEIKWLINNGFGNFTDDLIAEDHEVNYTSEVFIMDKDGDGDLDILFIGEDRMLWYLNDGNQSFPQDTIREFYSSTGYNYIAGVGDFNDDTNLDILYYLSGDVIVLESNNLLEYNHVVLLEGSTYDNLSTLDIDNDGDLDIISVTELHIVCHENIGNQIYKSHVIPKLDPNIVGIDIEDINQDGKEDVLLCYSDKSKIFWLENNGTFTFIEHSINTNMYGFLACKAIDLDQDGDIDILSSLNTQSGSAPGVIFYENDGNQVFVADTLISNSGIVLGMRYIDLDQDGDMDIVTRETGSSGIYWYENDGNQNFTNHFITPLLGSYQWYKFDLGDLNNDGYIDIVSHENILDYSILYYLNDGNENFSWTGIPESSFGVITSMGIKDFDNDGDSDIITTEVNPKRISLYWNDGTLNFTKDTMMGTGLIPYELLIEDVDFDGDYDFITGNDGSIIVFENATVNDYLSVKVIPFVDNNQNGIFDSLDNSFYEPSVEISPSAYYNISSDTLVEYFLNVYDSYEFNLVIDTSIWQASDSLSRTIFMDSLLVLDTVLYIGISPINDWLIQSDVTGDFPRCGTSITHYFQIQNLGKRIDSAYVEYNLDDGVTYLSSEPIPDSINGQVLIYGFTDLLSSHLKQVSVQVDLPLMIDTNYHSLKSIVDTGQFVMLDSIGMEEIIRCSYDPNDKQVSPRNGDEGYVLNGSSLEYLIRFQNTGNDTAFVVEVRDTLDLNIDINTFELISFSDPVNVSIDQSSRVISFLFENINLTDTITNETDSHGFVKYKVSLIDSLVLDETIENKADIYFDMNLPITTNTTLNTIYDCSQLGDEILSSDTVFYLGWYNWLTIGINESFIESVSWVVNDTIVSNSLTTYSPVFYEPGINSVTILMENELCQKDTTLYFNVIDNLGLVESGLFGKINVYPNPTNGILNLIFEHEFEHLELRQLTMTGQLLSAKNVSSGKEFQFDVIGKPGLYFIEILKDGEILSRFKIIKN